MKRGKQQNNEFLDKKHSVMMKYYDTLEFSRSDKQLKREMKSLIEKDPNFYDPYITLAEILFSESKDKEAGALLENGYQLAMTRIVDVKGNFPESLPWLWLENRHIIRIIHSWATKIWGEEKTEEALAIFRKLLHSNLNDNIGARYSILAIRLGLNSDYELEFETEDMPGYLDAAKVMDWFDKNSKKFMDEFEWWFNQMRDQA